MKTIYQRTVKMPTYALCYLINADPSGLEPKEVKLINTSMRFYENIAKMYNGNIVYSPVNDEPYFTWNPEFGLACDVIDCEIVILS